MENFDIGVIGGGLKCDNPDCDFVDMSINMEDYKEWINAPCPKCGANLLTQEDYDNTQILLKVASMFGTVGKREKQDGDVTLTARFDGTGKINFDIE